MHSCQLEVSKERNTYIIAHKTFPLQLSKVACGHTQLCRHALGLGLTVGSTEGGGIWSRAHSATLMSTAVRA